jgi:hypothetical protein
MSAESMWLSCRSKFNRHVKSQENIVFKFVAGFVLGVVIASVGYSGISRILDKGVNEIQTQSKELAK